MFTRSRPSQTGGTTAPTPRAGTAATELRSDADPRAGEPERAGAARVGVFWSAASTAGPGEAFLGSGASVAAAAWCRALARDGGVARVDIFTHHNQMGAGQEQLGGLPRRAFGGRQSVARLLPEAALPPYLRAGECDVLHDPVSIDFTRTGYARSCFSDRLFPITCSQHGISSSQQLHSCFVKLLTAPLYPCDAVVCLTPASREALEKRLRQIAERYSRAWDQPPPPLPRLELIPWGVDTQLFAPRDPLAARRELGLPLDRPILLCLGRLRVQDKMDWTPLLLAFDRVRRSVSEPPVLVLAGANPSEYGQRLVAQAAQFGFGGDVRTFFNLPAACLPALYAACDVFISPADSPSESFGLTVIEAMACGRPVVASAWDGYKELIVHGETGFKVRTDWADCLGELDLLAPILPWDQEHLHVGQSVSVDVGQMAGHLTQLLTNRDLREKMGRQGRERATSLYDWRVVIAQWEAMWAELAAIARTLERRQRDDLDYLRPSYFAHFCHYASRIIDTTTPAQLTARGKDLLAGRGPLLLHPWAEGFLHPELLRAALAALKPTGWLGAAVPVGDVLRVLRKAHGVTADHALTHLLWLAKYDLISFGGEEAAGS